MQVAVIMRSKNEQPYAERSLESLFKQDYKDFVLYNVDSGSTDGTLEAIKRFNCDNVVEISPEAYIPGKVLNDMIERTHQEVVVFLNSDAIPQGPEWLRRLIQPILSGDADATMGKQIARQDAYFIVDYDYRRAYDPRVVAKNGDFFSAVACAFRRGLWEETKFYTDGLSEDLFWSKQCREKGARFAYVPEAVVEHSHNYTFRELYRRMFGEAVAEKHIYGVEANFSSQIARFGKDIVRDLFYALSKGELSSVPYNIAYRSVIHTALYLGKR